MKAFNLKEYRKNPSKKIVTRDGRNVTIHCANCVGSRPVVAEIEGDNYSLNFTKYGRYYFGTSDVDLFFVPEKHEGWINIYADINDNSYPGNHIFKSKEEAEEDGKKWRGYVTTIKIEWEE